MSHLLASAIFELGFVVQADKFATCGREELTQGIVNGLKKVMAFASDLLPKWIQPAWKP